MDVILKAHTKGMDVIPKVWMLYQRYGCNTGMDVILKVWMLYQRYGCYTKGMDVIPKV